MSKSKTSVLDKIGERLAFLYKKIKDADWDDPKVILIAIACIVFPFAAWYYIMTGLVLGLIKAISILWLIEKAPLYIKEIIIEYPFASDIILNLCMLMIIGHYFGAGLTLGLGAIFSMIFISWALPKFADRVRKQREEYEKANASKEPQDGGGTNECVP